MKSFEDLLQILSEEPRPFSSAELAARLAVSTRTIRNYVTAANEHFGRVITSSHSGYCWMQVPWSGRGCGRRRLGLGTMVPRPGWRTSCACWSPPSGR
ncbi:helix-turn-helix domain-containing protein [Actinomyces ruminis]|uniref:Helix-turn-helix domain-containing protein n=1 Tax=Actinomyces ruminis TaxID=1937003 RepID=A0ABX4MED0_9ACTO|nr:helix-turn-helix domain-containing protein [Actinomyces ruminis]PHP53576.1 helix-turn-helix domain-containing protein [Actinomyces ruminis]